MVAAQFEHFSNPQIDTSQVKFYFVAEFGYARLFIIFFICITPICSVWGIFLRNFKWQVAYCNRLNTITPIYRLFDY